MARAVALAAWIVASWVCGSIASTEPFLFSTSSKSYGPDGPWQAVKVQIGISSNGKQDIDLYPGGIFESTVLASQTCGQRVASPCGAGGLFDSSDSRTFDNESIGFGRNSTSVDYTDGAMRCTGIKNTVMDTLTLTNGDLDRTIVVSNWSMALVSRMRMSYPDGTLYPVQVGQLSLGPVANQSFDNVRAKLVPGAIFEQGSIPSSSFGLHIGSAALNLPLSLVLGGYDRSRVSGEISSQPVDGFSSFAIDLLDVGIGVESGGSPFPYSSRQGILADGNSSVSSALPVIMNPMAPYLSLPNSTCAAIARDLPVTYQAKYGLYFWNTADPRYEQIVTSPSYLGFTFRKSLASTANFTVKVPFRLLNLTLEAPLIPTPTSYFPCQPPQAGGQYSLGRAFLQAAFIGVVWDEPADRTWYLAQAPGPNIASQPSQVPFTNSIGSPSSNKWSETWNGHWTPLPVSGAPPTPASPQFQLTENNGGLSSGAKAGIGIGCVAVAALAIGVAIILIRKRARRSSTSPSSMSENGYVLPPEQVGWQTNGQDGKEDIPKEEVQRYEAPGPGPVELQSNNSAVRHELPASVRTT